MCTVLGYGFCVLNPVIKIRYLLLLIPNIPLLQHSIIPRVAGSKMGPDFLLNSQYTRVKCQEGFSVSR